MGLSRGLTLAVTEQITNTKLHNLVDQTNVSVNYNELSSGMLNSLASVSGRIPSFIIIPSMASGATVKYDGNRGFYGV